MLWFNRGISLTIAAGVLVFQNSPTLAQVEPAPPSLKDVDVASFAPDLTGIVRDEASAIILGKALFWDMQVGSDGQACASCHFQAGADPRLKNQISPGLLGGNGIFDTTGSGGSGSNHTFDPTDFPFHVLSDPTDRNSTVLFDTDDVASSAGTFGTGFLGVIKREQDDVCEDGATTGIFHDGGGFLRARNVEQRNTPTVINAWLNFDNFWDGRAKNAFNGKDPFGLRSIKFDPTARIIVTDGSMLEEFVVNNSSAASQAVGPPLSGFEMSCAGRTFPELGRKIIAAIPLAFQKVAADDSVLGSLVQSDGTGLATSYSRLIRKAFDRRYWGKSRRDKFTFAPDGTLVPDSSGFTQMEHNFSMFFGLAIQLYEATLISDDSPFDKFAKKTGGDDSALTAQQKSGLEIFLGQGKCIACHSSAMFTKASLLHLQDENEEEGLVEHMLMGDANNGPALYDNGFYNIGVTPTFEDIGRGGTGPFGVPLSFTRQFTDSTPPCTTDAPNDECIDMFEVNPCTFEIPFTGQTPANCANFIPDGGIADHRVAVDGAMKVPTLRNVGLTAPFFHNGGQATLAQVVAFYNRGGDRRGNCNDGNTDTTALRDGPCNLDPDIDVLGLDSGQQEDLVAFLLALTDERVNCEKAPFDHPEITVTEGHSTTDSDGDGKADDIMLTIDAVGAGGLSSCFTNSGDYFIK